MTVISVSQVYVNLCHFQLIVSLVRHRERSSCSQSRSESQDDMKDRKSPVREQHSLSIRQRSGQLELLNKSSTCHFSYTANTIHHNRHDSSVIPGSESGFSDCKSSTETPAVLTCENRTSGESWHRARARAGFQEVQAAEIRPVSCLEGR